LDDAEVVNQSNQKRCWSTAFQKPLGRFFTAETLRRRESVGRAVHCAPGLVMQTQLPGLNLVFPRPYARGYELLVCWCAKHDVNSGCGKADGCLPHITSCVGKAKPLTGLIHTPLLAKTSRFAVSCTAGEWSGKLAAQRSRLKYCRMVNRLYSRFVPQCRPNVIAGSLRRCRKSVKYPT